MNDLIVRSHARSFLQQPLLAFLPLLISLKPILLLLFYFKKTFIAVQWRLRTGFFFFSFLCWAFWKRKFVVSSLQASMADWRLKMKHLLGRLYKKNWMSSNYDMKGWRYLVSCCFWAWINCQNIYIVVLVLIGYIACRKIILGSMILQIEWLRSRTKKSLNFLMTIRIFINLWNQNHLSVSFVCLLKYLLNFTWYLTLSHDLDLNILVLSLTMINNLMLITMEITKQV